MTAKRFGNAPATRSS